MDAVALLHRAQEAGLRIEPMGDKLLIRGPKRLEPIVKLLAEHKAEVLAVLGYCALERTIRARASVRPQSARGRRRAWTRDALRGSAWSNSTSGRSLPALLRRVRSLWSLRLWRQSSRWPVGPLVLPRASATKTDDFISWLSNSRSIKTYSQRVSCDYGQNCKGVCNVD